MSKIKQLEAYTAASKAVAEFKAAKAKVFDEYDSLLIAAQRAETELKQYVRDEAKDNIANDFVKVTYSPAFSRFYDPAVVIEMATPKVKKALVDSATLTTVQKIDSDKFNELVEKGEVPVEIKQAAFRETELAPRVSI